MVIITIKKNDTDQGPGFYKVNRSIVPRPHVKRIHLMGWQHE